MDVLTESLSCNPLDKGVVVTVDVVVGVVTGYPSWIHAVIPPAMFCTCLNPSVIII